LTAQLTLRGISKSYGDRLVLDRVSLTVGPGEHAGIVGENGSGKSTLLRLIAGIEAPDDGEVTVVVEGGIGHLGQTLGLPAAHTVQQAIDTALADLRAMERRMRELEADLTEDRLAEYGDVLATYEARGGYEAEARTDKSLHGLGLAHIDRDRRLGSLSGGERARLGLACLLAASPEVLLLDEPTNHLDASSMEWLEERLRAHRGTVVAVSHDRLFLDRVVTSILAVESGAVTRYGGGYAGFRGPNGAGKSTLLRLLAGEIEPDEGTVRRRGRIGYLPQETVFTDPQRSVLDIFAEGRAGQPEEHRTRLLSLGLFHPDALTTPVRSLSIGQQRRLAVARLLTAGADLLLLDEPTNHLSLTLVEEFEAALGSYRGALVLVSHDRTLRGRFTGTRLRLHDGRLT
jgi:ATPase subunit of ABC transporter with duplicated ATPase domains